MTKVDLLTPKAGDTTRHTQGRQRLRCDHNPVPNCGACAALAAACRQSKKTPTSHPRERESTPHQTDRRSIAAEGRNHRSQTKNSKEVIPNSRHHIKRVIKLRRPQRRAAEAGAAPQRETPTTSYASETANSSTRDATAGATTTANPTTKKIHIRKEHEADRANENGARERTPPTGKPREKAAPPTTGWMPTNRAHRRRAKPESERDGERRGHCHSPRTRPPTAAHVGVTERGCQLTNKGPPERTKSEEGRRPPERRGRRGERSEKTRKQMPTTRQEPANEGHRPYHCRTE